MSTPDGEEMGGSSVESGQKGHGLVAVAARVRQDKTGRTDEERKTKRAHKQKKEEERD